MKKEESLVEAINKVPVTICSYNKPLNKFDDQRIPGYFEQSWPNGCINCQFRHCGRKLGNLNVNCGLVQDDRGLFAEVSPVGKCERYKEGESLFL